MVILRIAFVANSIPTEAARATAKITKACTRGLFSGASSARRLVTPSRIQPATAKVQAASKSWYQNGCSCKINQPGMAQKLRNNTSGTMGSR